MQTTNPDMIGEAPGFLDALAHTSSLAPLDRPILVLGERGTGKELFGARLHFLSTRWDGPFVKVNCAALSEELLESELFGHEAGAFTGASKRHTGRFERADGGTLFLDEIGTASLRIQEKLLRVIEYGEYERVGGSQTLTADVRVIGATNANLAQAAQDGHFRADLLDRLAFDVINAPPLRQRRGDIPLLTDYFAGQFLREHAELYGGPGALSFSVEARKSLREAPWPGNVRALKAAVERSIHHWLVAGQTGPVDKVSIDPFARQTMMPPLEAHDDSADDTGKPFDLRARLDEIEKTMTVSALIRHGWNQRKTADFLHLTYNQIRGLVRKHQLSEPAD
ncbi:MAG: sigma 54-interacting transcriptional regulator [Pseudomonadota bacterium]